MSSGGSDRIAAGGGGGGGGGGGRIVTDQHIAEALNAVLREQNPNNPTISTLNGVVQHLEAKLGLNLSPKIDFIRAQIQLFFRPPPQAPPPQQQQLQSPAPPQQQHFTLQQHHNLSPNFSPNIPHFLPPNYVVNQYAFRPQQQYPHQPQPHILPPQQQLLQPPRSVVTTVAAPPPAPAIPAAEPPKESAPTKKRRGGPGGLNKLCGVSPELQVVLGQPTMPRTEIVRQLWQYIRKNNLQDPNNKRKIICNDELRVVFQTDSTDMFKMNKLLAKHIIALEPTKQPNSKRVKVEVESASEPTVVQNARTGQNQIVVLSEALANFFGSSKREMTQQEVTRQMWEYISTNQLEDPLNKMAIQCDAKLQELFGCPSISAVGIQEMLARHHLFQKS